MNKRKAIPGRQKIDALLWLATSTLHTLPGVRCHVCRGIVDPGAEIDWDHAQPISRGGDNHYTNVRPVHRECHKKKTFRPRGGATTLGGDNYEAKKTARLARKVKGTWRKPKKKLKARGFQDRPAGHKYHWSRK